MGIREDGQDWTIKEQIVEDLASGLTLQFETMPDGSRQLLIFGDILPFGNRVVFFNEAGEMSGAGTHTSGKTPTWPTKIDDS